jgi:hypothetical protein
MNQRLSNILIVLVCIALSSLSAYAATPTPKPTPETKPTNVPVDPIAKEASPTTEPAVSVLERFRTYSGPRTPAALCALFTASPTSKSSQQPEIVLSNGAATISITAVVAVPNDKAPNVAFNGARMLSYERTPKGELQFVALPEVGAWRAELIVLGDSNSIEIPLIIAPPLPAEMDLSEKGFISFLGGKTPTAQPLLDLNGDGSRDYLDTYIFTANYLVRKRSGVPEPERVAPDDPEGALDNQNPESQSPADATPVPEQLNKAAEHAPDVQNPGSGFNAGNAANPTTRSNPSTPLESPATQSVSTAAPPAAGTSTTTTEPTDPATPPKSTTLDCSKITNTVQRNICRNEKAKQNTQAVKNVKPVTETIQSE